MGLLKEDLFIINCISPSYFISWYQLKVLLEFLYYHLHQAMYLRILVTKILVTDLMLTRAQYQETLMKS